MQLSFGHEPLLYVAGYKGRDLDAFVRRIHHLGIVQLIDIREHPTSRRPGFGKSSLISALAPAGVAYVHFGEADNPYRHGEEPLDERLAKYASHLDAHPEIVRRLGDLVKGRTSVLLGFERELHASHGFVLGTRVGREARLRVLAF